MATKGEILARISERLKKAEDISYTIGHLYKEQGDFAFGQGFLAIGEMFRMTNINVVNLATGKLRKDANLR